MPNHTRRSPATIDLERFELPPERLRWVCDPGSFSFDCTDELAPRHEFIGQQRAIGAIQFGLGVDQAGYNIFVTGITGTGKASIIKAHIRELLRKSREGGKKSVPSDWCYVFNSVDPDRPRGLRLPAGTGRRLKARIEKLRDEIGQALTAAFATPEYEAQRKAFFEESQEGQRALFEQLDKEARERGLGLQFGPSGVLLIPLIQGRPATPDQLAQMSPEERRSVGERQASLLGRVEETLEQAHEIDATARGRLEQLNQQVAEFVTTHVFGAVRKEFPEEGVAQFLDELRAFTLEHLEAFRESAVQPGPGAAPHQAAAAALGFLPETARLMSQRDSMVPFVVNVFVDNTDAQEAPVIIEDNPTFANLFGRIERRFVLGGYVTDHTMLKAGSLSRANGGYLIVNMRDVATAPFTWETLKRVIQTKQIRPEDPAEAAGIAVQQSIKAEPLPLDVKVIVTGDPSLYNLLAMYDEDFWEIFKVRADFGHQITRSEEHLGEYGSFICRACQELKLRHFNRDGVAKVLEYSARMVADQRKLSTRFGPLRDLLIEADYWAGQEGAAKVGAPHVQKAIAQKVFRSDLIAEYMRQMTQEGTIMVDLSGSAVGQVNGLAVIDLGDVAFGRPSRITARTYIGRGNFVNIEREAKLSGRTHDKGVLIISGFLGARYAQEAPLSLTVSLAFEQSYDVIDGDSASSTEIYAILSSLAGKALRQDIAVTGSMNQRGEVQPIGGVNQKIEGFYDLCAATGLTGQQGVMIPRRNVANLMLREDVVEAVREGRFHVYAVENINQGIEVLTGTPAGERGVDGHFPPGSINALVEGRLQEYAKVQRRSANGHGELEEAAAAAEGAGSVQSKTRKSKRG